VIARPRNRALAVSRFVPYKSVRLAIEACAAAGVPLTVAGKGPEEASLRELTVELKADVEFDAPAARAFVVNGVPEAVLIGPDGHILWRGHPQGEAGSGSLESRINDSLKK